MNDQEIEALWHSQSYEGLSEGEIFKQLRKHRRLQKWETLGLMVVTPVVVGIWLWRLVVAFSVPGVVSTASIVEVLILSLMLAVNLFAVYLSFQGRRQFEKLKSDTRSFVEFLVENTRKEIWAVTRFIPLWLGAILLLSALRNWQLIQSGHQSYASAKSLIFPAALFLIAWIGGLVRAKETLKPNLESLKKSRAAFED